MLNGVKLLYLTTNFIKTPQSFRHILSKEFVLEAEFLKEKFIGSWFSQRWMVTSQCDISILLTPGMTEESHHTQLTNQINFVPALCDPSNMNAFTIFIQNSSLIDNRSTKCKCCVDMNDQICSILNHCLDYHVPPGKFLQT